MGLEMKTYEEKLKSVLQLILSADYQIQNDCHLNTLLSHLSGKENKELGAALVRLPAVREWIPQAIHIWELKQGPLALPISSFIINLIAILSKDEETFGLFSTLNIYVRLFQLININGGNIQPTIKLGYVKVLASLLEHKLGTQWVMSNDIWKDCLNFCLENETIYIIREGHNFLFNLLTKSIDLNGEFVGSVVEEIYMKFNSYTYDTSALCPQVESEGLEKHLGPKLKLLIHILNNLLSSDMYKKYDYRLIRLFIKKPNFELAINKFLILTSNGDSFLQLNIALCYIKWFELCSEEGGEKIGANSMQSYFDQIFALINNMILGKQTKIVIKFCHFVDSLWNRLQDRMPSPVERPNKEPIIFQNQILVFEVLPMTAVSYIHCQKYFVSLDNDLKNDYLDTFFKSMSQNTVRLGYTWREVILSETDCFDLAKFSMLQALNSIPSYTRNRAVIIFRALAFIFRDYLDGFKDDPQLLELFAKNSNYLITFFETVYEFINNFDITWRDSLESICIMSYTVEFIKSYNWPPRLLVRLLLLLKLSISKYLSPCMALLSDDEFELNNLGVSLKAALYDVNWEVRDSSLETVHVIADLADARFPLFQKMLLDMEVIPLLITMSTNDAESFVRASAIKCLQEMIKVQELWTQVLVKQELPIKMIHILKTEPEAIVRKEAASLMSLIYEFRSIPEELMPTVHMSMAWTATHDLHWEVKSAAISFWGKAIRTHLEEQAYIDGKFPSVTFSKETRKIVQLNTAELKSRMGKVLRQLSDIGCLDVLVAAVQEDCDINVTRMAVGEIKFFADILKTHDVYDDFQADVNVTQIAPQIASMAHKENPRGDIMKISDEILDQIINSDDLNLLGDVLSDAGVNFESNEQLFDEYAKNNVAPLVTPEVFMQFTRQDLDAIVASRTDWLNRMDTIGSLLDDMLKTYDVTQVNAMDCY